MTSSPLLKELEKSLESKKSYDNYVSRLTKLMQITGQSLEYILLHPKETYTKIKANYPNVNTRKNMLTPILTLYRVNSNTMSGHDNIQKEWKKYHDDMTTLQEVSAKKNKLSKKQEKNYTSTEDVELKLIEMQKGDPHITLKGSQQFILLTLLTDVYPKRSDFGKVRIYRNIDPNKSEENYIVLQNVGSNAESYLVLTHYKTAKTYGRLEEELKASTVQAIKESLRRHPRDYLFVGYDKKPYETNDAYGKFVVRTFEELFEKKTGTSLWRHIFITEKVDPGSSQEKLEEVSSKMLHSLKQQQRYRAAKQTKQRKLCVCIDKE
jgi:hypothetical protein